MSAPSRNGPREGWPGCRYGFPAAKSLAQNKKKSDAFLQNEHNAWEVSRKSMEIQSNYRHLPRIMLILQKGIGFFFFILGQTFSSWEYVTDPFVTRKGQWLT